MAVEHELRDKVRLLTGVVENNMALIYAKDLEGRYLFYNGTFARAFVLDERAADEGTSAAEVLLGATTLGSTPSFSLCGGLTTFVRGRARTT